MTTATPSFVVIYHAHDIAEAYIIRTALEEAGIAAQIENEFLQSGVGELPIGWTTGPHVLVDESDVSAANEFIAQINSHANAESSDDVTADATSCLACGTKMSDVETKCSACGWTYDEPV